MLMRKAEGVRKKIKMVRSIKVIVVIPVFIFLIDITCKMLRKVKGLIRKERRMRNMKVVVIVFFVDFWALVDI